MWADYSENLASQWKQAPRSAISAHYAAVNNPYLSNNDCSLMQSDHTKGVDNQSLDRRSLSEYNDNAFVTFKASPPPVRKKAAEKIKCDNRSAKSGNWATTPSNNNSKAMVYAQPFAALAKGLNEPLVFSLEDN